MELHRLTRPSFVVLVAILFAIPAREAEAQNLFEMLGRWFSGPAREAPPPDLPSAGDERGMGRDERVIGEEVRGPSKVFCVRLCDGAFFPLSDGQGKTDPAQLCNSLCPAVTTEIYRGSQIDHAVSRRGTSYSKLEKAFAFREQVTADCSCTGRIGGTARIDPASDPTLKPGDLVVTTAGVKRFNGGREIPYPSNAFSPARVDLPVAHVDGARTSLRVHPRRDAAEEPMERD